MFDELVHAFTTFAGITALIWMATHNGRLLDGASALSVVASALLAGLILGLVWEGFEWVIGIIGSQRDTVVDLAMACLGAVTADVLPTIFLGATLGSSRVIRLDAFELHALASSAASK